MADGGTALHYGQFGLEWRFDGTNTEYYTRTPGGQLVGIVKNSSGTITSRYPLFDQLGSVVAQTDSSGANARTFSYTPYGVRTASGGTAFDDTIGYAGGADTTGSLIHFGERLYDPSTARWTQMDPLGALSQDYSYAADDPINHADSSGLIGYAPCGLSGEKRCPRPQGGDLQGFLDFGAGCYSGGKYGVFYGDAFASPEAGGFVGCVAGGLLSLKAGENLLDKTPEPPER